MQNNAEDIAIDIINKLKNYFGSRFEGFSVCSITDEPYKMFSIKFTAYNYFSIILNYDRGSFGCSISNGGEGIALKSNQNWYDKADMNIFFKELEQQIELRIPDKFLEFYGWK
ncbi:MAG: hypothetical protein ABFC84_02475 [Veillonellales bacterium]